MNDANDEAAPRYSVVSLSGRYRVGQVELFARLENATDEPYTNRVQVNDSGGFYYYPSPGRRGSVGLRLRW